MTDLTHNFRHVGGIRIHYVTAGSRANPTLVLLAGFPESWYAWRKAVTYFVRYCHVIVLDLPGQGDSDKPMFGYDTQTIAIRVHDLLSDLNVSKYSLAAHDIGAWVAFPYAMMFSQEIEHMALIDAGIPGITLPEKVPTSPDDAWRTWHFLFHMIPDLPEALINGRESIYLDWFLRRKAASSFSFSQTDIDEYMRILTKPGSLRASLAYYRACVQSAEQNRLLLKAGKLQVRVLAVSSDQGSIRDMRKPLSQFITNIEGVVIENCGHYIPEEQPKELVRHLLKFFYGLTNPSLD